MNDTELIQRGEGLFTQGRWRKQSTAEILTLNTHIKRHPNVESCGEAPRSVEQENSHYVGHVCFIDSCWSSVQDLRRVESYEKSETKQQYGFCAPPQWGGLDLDSRSSGCARLGGGVGPPLGVVVEEVAVLVLFAIALVFSYK